MTKAITFEKSIDNNLKLKLKFAIIYIKNNQPIQIL